MDMTFSQSLTEWTGFFALMGGAAATLLGLLFVAVSLRLNIFRQREVADIRAFAAFTLATFLVALAVAGIVLAPHERREALALLLLLAGVAGVLAIVQIARLWISLNLPARGSPLGNARYARQGAMYFLVMSGPYAGLLAVSLLLWQAHPDALALLALVEGWLLVLGTAAAWLMLSHAGVNPDGGAESDSIDQQ